LITGLDKIVLNNMDASSVRQSVMDFFTSKHKQTYVHSSSTISLDDPLLLFANAGMKQFKSIFVGSVDPNSNLAKLKWAVNLQECICAGGKHNNLDDIGKDTYHHTFYEMLGNWSFGDYFKEIIAWLWEYLTKVASISWDLSPTSVVAPRPPLSPTLRPRQMWADMGVPLNHILPRDMKENFWEMRETGPCDNHFGGRNAANLMNQDDPHVLKIWNLVFMQFNNKSNCSLVFAP